MTRNFGLSLFAIYSVPAASGVIIVHWVIMVIMFVWLLYQDTQFYEGRYQKALFKIVVAVFYVFLYVEITGENTKTRHIMFNTLITCEGILMNTLFIVHNIHRLNIYYIILLAIMEIIRVMLFLYLLTLLKEWALHMFPRDREDDTVQAMQRKVNRDPARVKKYKDDITNMIKNLVLPILRQDMDNISKQQEDGDQMYRCVKKRIWDSHMHSDALI